MHLFFGSFDNFATGCHLILLHRDVPVNNILCYQRPEHELNEAKTRVLDSCYTRDSVSYICRVPLVFSTRVLSCYFWVKTRVKTLNKTKKQCHHMPVSNPRPLD